MHCPSVISRRRCLHGLPESAGGGECRWFGIAAALPAQCAIDSAQAAGGVDSGRSASRRKAARFNPAPGAISPQPRAARRFAFPGQLRLWRSLALCLEPGDSVVERFGLPGGAEARAPAAHGRARDRCRAAGAHTAWPALYALREASDRAQPSARACSACPRRRRTGARSGTDASSPCRPRGRPSARASVPAGAGTAETR